MERPTKTCQVDGCDGKHYATGLCKKHYTQVLRHGRLTPESERGIERVCQAPGCSRMDTVRGYCRKHARQIRVHGRLTPEREHVRGRVGCMVEGCDGAHRAKGYCARHYNRLRGERIERVRSRGRRRKISKA